METSVQSRIKQYITLIEKVSKVEQRRIPSHMVEFEELVSIGIIAVQALIKNKTEEKVKIESAYGVLQATRLYKAEAMLDNNLTLNGNLFEVIKTRYQGQKPDSGEIYIKNDDIALLLKYGRICYVKNFNDNNIIEMDLDCTLK